MRKIVYLSMISLFIFSGVSLSWAMMCESKMKLAQAQEAEMIPEEKEVVEVGNKVCPVSGEEIEEDEAIKVEYEGKIYNFCCKACVKDFKKDPQKYIKKVEEELEARSKEETEATKMVPEPAASQGMHEGHHQGTHEEHHH